ncbi:uncharacterized protein LOC125193528 [Salvia hispanica]|uniref:uncharacterized protein LOC125193528 n=1 Tax=Salvia hispanica TaxID=49212 RepID=UPI002009CA56|nr:uncharacterized protein LOC125193528 [Salvia hispanica]
MGCASCSNFLSLEQLRGETDCIALTVLVANEISTNSSNPICSIKNGLGGLKLSLQMIVKAALALQFIPMPKGYGTTTFPHFSRQPGFDRDVPCAAAAVARWMKSAVIRNNG